jgi:hypothetical protein
MATVRRITFAGLLALALIGAARANDGVLRVDAGGVTPSATTVVRMLSEDLRISVDQVAVSYLFENPTDKPVTLTLGFPMPPVPADDFENQFPDHRDGGPLIPFTTRFDGHPVEARQVITITGMEDGRDLTDLFRREGFPLDPLAEIWWPDVYYGDSPEATALRDRLATLGLLGNFSSRPWTVTVTQVWEATFPARSQVAVHHAYAPIAGAFQLLLDGDGGWDWFREDYCVDDDALSTLRALPPEVRASGFARNVGYVLTNATTWAGSIGSFRLVLDEGVPGTITSTCWEGAFQRTSPTTLEFTARDFVPDRDLAVVFVPAPPGQ